MAQQEQLKELILTNNKTFITYRFQPVQRLQTEFYDLWHKKLHIYQAQRRLLKTKNILFYTSTTR